MKTPFYNEPPYDLYSGARALCIDAGAMIPCTTNGALQKTIEWPNNDIDLDCFAFDGGATPERVQFKLRMPASWDLSTLTAQFDWTGDTGCSAADTVEWRIKARAIGNDDTIDSAMGTAQVISDAVIANNGTKWQTSGSTPAITVGGTPAAGCIVLFEVDRNGPGADTMAEDGLLFGVAISYGEA